MSIEKYKDAQEQSELEELVSTMSKTEINQELNNIGSPTSEFVELKGKRYKRKNLIINIIKERRDFKCQICGIKIKTKDKTFYIEAAHITRKSEGGSEMPDNIMILCPNHHKEFDYGDTSIIKRSKEQLVFKMNENEYKINLALEQSS